MGRIHLTSVLNELLQKTPIEKLPAITLDNEFPEPKRRREAVQAVRFLRIVCHTMNR